MNPLILPLLPITPNWAEGLTLSIRAQTDIVASQLNREERNARLLTPALGIKLKLDTRDRQAQAAQLVRFFRDNIGQQILAPVWSDLVVVGNIVGGITVNCSPTANRLFSPTRAAAIYNERTGALASFPIATITANQIVANCALPSAFGPDSLIAPCFISEPVTEDLVAAWLAGYQAQSSLELKETVDQAQALPFTFAVPTYRGLPLFPFQFNWGEQLEETTTIKADSAKDDVGNITAIVYESTGRVQPHGHVLLQHRSQVAALLTWFTATLGQFARGWVSAQRPNFTLTAPTTNGTSLVVRATGYAASDLIPQRQFIFIRDGNTWYARKITAAYSNGDGTETLIVDSVVPALTTQAVISQLYLCRSQRDELDLDFQSIEIAAVEVEFNELPSETSDLLAGTSAAIGTVTEGMFT